MSIQFGAARAALKNVQSIVLNPVRTAINLGKIDIRFANPLDFKPNDLGFVTNNWVRLSSREVNDSFGSQLQIGLTDILTEADRVAGYDLDGQGSNFIDVLLFDVLLDVTLSPKVVYKQVRGLDGTLKQYFGNDDYTITITGKLSSPVTWHPDTYSIENLNALAKLGRNLYLQNPELNKLYNINRVSLSDLRITDYAQANGIKEFVIVLKSDFPTDIITRIERT